MHSNEAEDVRQWSPCSLEQRKTLALNEPSMTHSQMNTSIAKLWRVWVREFKLHLCFLSFFFAFYLILYKELAVTNSRTLVDRISSRINNYLLQELPQEEMARWNELAIAVQKTENTDKQIPLCIPVGLKVEEETENENIDQNPRPPIASWIHDKRMFQPDSRKNRQQVPDHTMWEHLRSLPVNTFPAAV